MADILGAISAVAGAIGGWVSEKLLAPAMVAVVFTGLTNIYLEGRKATRDLTTKITDTLRDDLRALQTLAVDYWSRKRKSGDDAIEARIVALQDEVLQSVSLLADEFGLDVCSEDDPRPDLLDSLSGGEFGSASRDADAARLVRASKSLSDLRARLIRLRAAHLRTRGN